MIHWNDDAFQSEIEKCIGCGSCLHACPVYRECPDERVVSRGRNQLLRSLGYDAGGLSGDVAELFSRCLLCAQCVAACPRGVKNDLVVMAARAELIRRSGLGWKKSMAFRSILADRRAMGRALRLASKLQRLLPGKAQGGGEKAAAGGPKPLTLRHLPLFFMGLSGGRHLPSIAGEFLSETLPESNPATRKVDGRELRVAFFAGCATEFVLPRVGHALVRLLNARGVDVVFPKDQGCCGLAVQANGDVETARSMALANLEALNRCGADIVVTGCATCGSQLKEGWKTLFRGDPREAAFKEMGERVRDVSELLVELADYKPLRFRSGLPPGTRVTYHEPCHLSRHQGVREQPRRILDAAFGNAFTEMDRNGCCGCGGSFALSNPELSKRIGEEKIDAVERSRAEVVVNTCPGCMMQLVDGIERRGAKQRVFHLVEVVEPDPE